MNFADLLGKPWELLLKWFPAPWIPISSGAIAISAWLLLTPERLRTAGLGAAADFRWVFLTLLFLLSLLGCKLVHTLSVSVVTFISGDRERRKTVKTLLRLTLAEKTILRVYVDRGVQSLPLNANSKVVASLINKRIIRLDVMANGGRFRKATYYCISNLVDEVLYSEAAILRNTAPSSLSSEDVY